MSGTNNIVIGLRSTAEHSGCLLIGDDLHSECNDQFRIGKHLCGREIPPFVESVLYHNQSVIRWLVKAATPVLPQADDGTPPDLR